MRWSICLISLIALMTAGCDAAEKAVEAGNEVVDTCAELAKEDLCPVGTTVSFDAGAVAECGGTVGGKVDLTSQSAEVAARCGSSGECSFLCVPPSCCGGEEWTDTSYKCETPCAASCSCSGKCGTVTGADCEAECGDCSGGQVCSADNVCVDECPEGAEVCGDECFFPVDGDVCFNGEVCEATKNCEGRACGSDGCGNPEGCGTCGSGESCNNGQCLADCKGSLPVCQDDVVQHCTSTNESDPAAAWAWQDKKDCSELSDTPYCDELSSGASCVECTEDGDDEQCGVGKACDLEKGVCIDTCVPVCTNTDGICETDDGSPELDDEGDPISCNVDGQCEKENCVGATKRYCGADGCGGFCDDVDYSCNGTGKWCNPDTGSCADDQAECFFTFEDNGEWQKIVIPHGYPFCNSITPDMEGVTLDPSLAAEAVVSGGVYMGEPDEIGAVAFENVCSWTVHEFEGGESVNCALTDQVCNLKTITENVNPFELLGTPQAYEDFECLDKAECADFGLLDGQSFCNFTDAPTYQEDLEEGLLFACHQKGDLAVFKCENCEDEVSLCSQEGWGCFTQPWSNNGECGPDGCGPEIPEGTEVGSCQEDQSSWCETEYMAQCIGPEAVQLAYSTCSYDPVTNENTADWDEGIACEDGTVCVGHVWTDEEKPACDDGDCGEDDEGPWWWKQVPATCQVSELCSNGELQEQFCNTVDHPDHDPTFSETQRLICQVENGAKIIKDLYSGDDGSADSSDCGLNNDEEYGAPMLCKVGYGEEGESGAECVADESTWCGNQDFFMAVCSNGTQWTDPGVTTCTYDPETNQAIVNDQPEPCADGLICVQQGLVLVETCNPDNPDECSSELEQQPVPATCQEPDVCPPSVADSNQYCNMESEPSYQDNLGYGVAICGYDDQVNAQEWTLEEECQELNQCFPGGPAPDGGDYLPGCSEPDPCPASSWCYDNAATSCVYDPLSNTQNQESSYCQPDGGQNCYLVDQDTGEEAHSQSLETDLAPEGWEAQCVNKACGPGFPADGNQPACYDPATECLDVSEGEAQEAFEAALLCPTDPAVANCEMGSVINLPTYACVPASGSCEDFASEVGAEYWTAGDDVYICSQDVYNLFAPPQSQTWSTQDDEPVNYVVRCTNTADGPQFDFSAEGSVLGPNGGPGAGSGLETCGNCGTLGNLTNCVCNSNPPVATEACEGLTTCGLYCSIQEQNCTGGNAIDFGADKTCESVCGTWPEGGPDDQSNNSAHCRLYHAAVAADDPQTHCPHAGPDGGGICVVDGA
jgi:hypothetical protein